MLKALAIGGVLIAAFLGIAFGIPAALKSRDLREVEKVWLRATAETRSAEAASIQLVRTEYDLRYVRAVQAKNLEFLRKVRDTNISFLRTSGYASRSDIEKVEKSQSSEIDALAQKYASNLASLQSQLNPRKTGDRN